MQKTIDNIFKKYLLQEENKSESWKKYVDDLWDGTKIYFVDGQYIRNNFFVDFTMGGHGYRYKFIPKNEIWFEDMLKDEDDIMDLIHEIIEYILMKYQNEPYNKAHPKAANVEDILRKLWKPKNEIQTIHKRSN